MKHLYLCAAFLAAGMWGAYSQTPVQVGSGSYASFPPASENVGYFVNDRPIYVSDGETRPIPTNDWWTSIIAEQYSGLLWAYPLMVDAEEYGARVFFPNSFVPDGSNIEYGGAIRIKATGYAPVKAIAKDWSDWGVVMGIPDATGAKNIDITMAHGVPFTWIETQGINPEFSYDTGATYLTGTGAPLTLPATGSFVIQSSGRYFGVHMAPNITVNMEGQQFVKIDLGSAQPITNLKLHWEAAYAKGYTVQVSNDNVNFTTVFPESNGNGGLDDIALSTSGRYVKLNLLERGTVWDFSLFEMQVYNGATLLSQGKPVEVTSVQGGFIGANLNDGNLATRWASNPDAEEKLVLNCNGANSYFVISALPSPSHLAEYDTYAFNKVINTEVDYDYDAALGMVDTEWNVTTQNLKGLPAGNTIQGFLPHLYENTTHSVPFTANNYVTPRGTLKTAIGNSHSFSYKFTGVLPSYNSPYSNGTDANPYDADKMFTLISQYASREGYGGDTYWGGKDLVNFAKYTLMAKEVNHQSYDALKTKTRNALVNWLTYSPGEPEKYFARYDRWGAIVGFNESYGSSEFVDNHFHYGYLIQACAMYSMVDPQFLTQYGDMIKLVARQYANWDKNDDFLPYLRTFDPWIGHSYAGGMSSATGNNQESTSEAMQSWTGLFLLGDLLDDDEIRNAAAFGYISEAHATLEYWFDWKVRNLPPAYAHNMVGILSNQGFAYGTYFSASPLHIHGIQYLPVNPGFKYLAMDTEWAEGEYEDMMTETQAVEGFTSEYQFGDDWAHVALGFRLLFDPQYVTDFLDDNMEMATNSPNYIMDYDVAGMTYYYAHANQNLGDFSFDYHTDFPSSSVFEQNGAFSHAVAYNPTAAAKTCTIYGPTGNVVGTFVVPGYTLMTYPELPTTGQAPQDCYTLAAASATATSGNAALGIDGNMGSRWESAFADPQTFTVDLGTVSTVNTVTIHWEAANAKDYTLSGSEDGENWVEIGAYTDMAEGNRTDVIDDIDADYRYLQMHGTARNLVYGYSIFEFQVCGSSGTPPPCTDLEVVSATATTGTAEQAIDNNDGTRWESAAADPQSITLDLGVITHVDKVTIDWETANAKDYTLRGSSDGLAWTDIAILTDMAAGERTDVIENIDNDYRYIRVDGTERNTIYGYSIWEIDVCGEVSEEEPEQPELVPVPIPALIQAEDFTDMFGIAMEATGDEGGGENVGWIDGGDWLEYYIESPTATLYEVDFRVASAAGGNIVILSEDAEVGTIAVPNTGGWQNWETITTTVTLPAGVQTIKLNAAGFNMNWLEFRLPTSGTDGFAQTGIAVYPNPARGTVNIRSNADYPMALYSITGALLMEQRIIEGENSVDISGLAGGVYLVKIGNNVSRLIIE
ncbi:discoidin domain-containing protein [Flavobacterium sp. MFBS3-15]|uniref:discoidin domain-containing protein n=1 Tax=Flavobacterium sp. MFBS3-15 TaxID=2989816 RepID=UPI0022364F85|nr:discoidin domain-containing protein [Flavobacterium sp. MFBS3-15]MCW4468042.1 discoidin domain-containing protein [Flavobacterium sp. MFBS3-15]